MHQTYFRILSAKLLDCQLRQKCYQIFFLICASLKMSILCESLHSNNINWRERVDDGIDEWKLRAVKSRKCASVHINDAIHNSLNVFKVLGMRKLPEGLLYAWNRKSMSGSILCRKYTQVRAHFMHVPLFIHHTLHTLYLPYYGENHFGNDFDENSFWSWIHITLLFMLNFVNCYTETTVMSRFYAIMIIYLLYV